MKRLFLILMLSILYAELFAQTVVPEKSLGKTLEKNKDSSAVFISEVDLSALSIAENGIISLPLFAKNKISVVSGMDMTNIKERISFANINKFSTTFETKDLVSKTYAITNIDGIETIAQYKERCIEEQKAEARRNLTRMPVQVVNQEAINLTGAESSWLPGQIQDKLKSNLQEFLGMKTVVDSKSETTLKKLQAESESAARDEESAIEFGKITTAKFALFTKLRKTGKGYIISVDFTDLTTGEQMASVTSKEYSSSDYLYGTTGAVDEITLSLGNKLGIPLSDLNKNLLTSGSAAFSVDEQLALAKQNEENFNKLMAQYDSDLAKLNISNDLSALENKKKIEAEKALLVEKQNSERKRQTELEAQKRRAEQDAKLESERSIALKTQRDEMAKQAAAKAEEVRKLKMEKQGVLGQINVIESKKKALVEIRQGVEARCQELYEQLVKDRESEEEQIKAKVYTTVELGSDGTPTPQALERRKKQIIKSNEDLTNGFFENCEKVKKSTLEQDRTLLTEIRTDQKILAKTKTVSSMGNELKVSFGTYEGSENGWKAFLSLYSEDVLIYTDEFIINYEGLSGKNAPDLTTELNDVVIEEYTNIVDMYNSLLVRGDPIIYFELDYNVNAESDNKPSEYNFNFNKLRVINTVSGKILQSISLSKTKNKIITPKNDLREFAGILEYEKARFDRNKYQEEFVMITTNTEYEDAKKIVEKRKELDGLCRFVKIPKKNYEVSETEVSEKLYKLIMGKSSNNYGDNYPEGDMNYIEAIYFCNKLSEMYNYEPCYFIGAKRTPETWKYTPYSDKSRKYFDDSRLGVDYDANGFRLPTEDEWKYFGYAGIKHNESLEYYETFGWIGGASTFRPFPIKQKLANDFGLYDTLGNVSEWVEGKKVAGSSYRHNYYQLINGELRDPVGSASLSSKESGSRSIGIRLVRKYEKIDMNNVPKISK